MKIDKRILGIDYGEAKIGLALSSDSLALPYKIITNDEILLEKIKEIIESEGIGLIIIGLPLGKMGEETESSEKVRLFLKKLRKNLEIEIDLFDERLTSAQAKSMNVEGDDDAHAASLILQSYIDKNGS